MNQYDGREKLEDVLNYYTASVSEPSSAVLWEWIQRYPHYERELTEFTVSWTLMENLPMHPEAKEADEEALVRRGMSVVEELLPEGQPYSPEDQPLTGLLIESKAQGLSLHELADATGLSPALVAKLDRRLIRLTTIPGEKIEALARTIRRVPEEVVSYLQGQPQFLAGAQYHAEEAPKLPEQQDFFEAVQEDRGLSEDRRRYLLALKRSQSE